MIVINGIKFYDEPTSCGMCPFLFIPGKDAPSFFPSGGSSGKHHCTLRNLCKIEVIGNRYDEA